MPFLGAIFWRVVFSRGHIVVLSSAFGGVHDA